MFDSQLWKSFSEGSDMRSQIMDAPILGFCFLVSWQIFFYNPFMQFSVKPYPKPHWNRGFASGRIWSLSIKKSLVQPMIWNHTKNNNYFPFKLWILYVDYNLLVFSPHFWSEQIPNFWEKAAKSPPKRQSWKRCLHQICGLDIQIFSFWPRKCSSRKSLMESGITPGKINMEPTKSPNGTRKSSSKTPFLRFHC